MSVVSSGQCDCGGTAHHDLDFVIAGRRGCGDCSVAAVGHVDRDYVQPGPGPKQAGAKVVRDLGGGQGALNLSQAMRTVIR